MPTTDIRPLKVFLSYASQDKPLVRELSRRLIGEGWIDTWQDEKRLLPGQDWRVKIEEAVEDADVVIIVLSQNSVSKEGHVQKELRYAREIALEKPEDAIFLIPLRLDECEVPRGLRFYQWVDYFGDTKDSSYKALVASLGLRYEQKINAEEAERLRKELQEREIAERIAREKAEKDAAEKARLKVEKEERQRIAKEKADREAAEKLVGEAEELARQKAAKEKAEREATERAEKERKAKELREKQAREAREKEKRESKKKEDKPVAVKPKAGGQIVYWFGGFIVLVLGIILLSSLDNTPATPKPTPENTQTQAIATLAQDTVEPSVTTPRSTSTPTSTLTPTSLPTEIADAKGVSMVLVPAGEFTMGSNTGNLDEKPVHQVYLDTFYIDTYEVTNGFYKICVREGVCTPPAPRPRIFYINSFSINQGDWYSWDSNPIASVSWNHALTFCNWRSARLPTEAEWEKAARGVDSRTYPWGEEISCDNANYSGCNDYAIYVGGNRSPSPFGVYDMAGNVWEWVADWYSANYYNGSLLTNPLGPASGEYRVIRGGAWNNLENSIRTTIRKWENPDSRRQDLGFRCAMDVNP